MVVLHFQHVSTLFIHFFSYSDNILHIHFNDGHIPAVTETKHTYRATELHERLQHGSTDVIRQSLIHCVWHPNEVSLIQGVISIVCAISVRSKPIRLPCRIHSLINFRSRGLHGRITPKTIRPSKSRYAITAVT